MAPSLKTHWSRTKSMSPYGEASSVFTVGHIVNNKMPLNPSAVHIYKDGSCYAIPVEVPACCNSSISRTSRSRRRTGCFCRCSEGSNNRMELLACIRALQWIRSNDPWPGVSRVQILTDSRDVTDNITRPQRWRKNDWRNQHGEPRENWVLWKKFLSNYHKVGMVLVAVIRPYRKNIMQKGENRVDVFSEETNRYRESCYAFASPELARELHRPHGYRVRFNDETEISADSGNS